MSDTSGLDRDSVNSREPPESPADADEINVTDVFISLALGILIALAKHKRVLMVLPAVAVLFAVGYSLMMPNIYTASTMILPPQENQLSAASSIAQLGRGIAVDSTPNRSVPQQTPSNDLSLTQLGNAAALIGAVAGRSSINDDLVTGVLKSRTVADSLIQRFDLIKVYGVTSASRAREQLARATTIASRKDRIITINVDHPDPKFAAELANGYVDELMKLAHLLSVTTASQLRRFFEHEFTQVKDNLKAQNSARHQSLMQALMNLDQQERSRIETTARLRAQITVKEMQIVAMRTFVGNDDNPNLKLAQQELETMKRELARIEGGAARADENHAVLRDLKYKQVLYELLAQQYEIARIDEARDSPIIRVLDRAVVPDEKSKPDRTLIVLLYAAVGFFAALIWIFVRVSIARAADDPQQAVRLETLRRYLAWR